MIAKMVLTRMTATTVILQFLAPSGFKKLWSKTDVLEFCVHHYPFDQVLQWFWGEFWNKRLFESGPREGEGECKGGEGKKAVWPAHHLIVSTFSIFGIYQNNVILSGFLFLKRRSLFAPKQFFPTGQPSGIAKRLTQVYWGHETPKSQAYAMQALHCSVARFPNWLEIPVTSGLGNLTSKGVMIKSLDLICFTLW